ncbi:hypothetical protein DSO57_1026678 [Entomophthora muscae]|nr:hypothetical protein DSO57_1026678 [Entomophthora muscae]
MVSEKASDHIISWKPCLTQVLVHNILEFEQSILVGLQMAERHGEKTLTLTASSITSSLIPFDQLISI